LVGVVCAKVSEATPKVKAIASRAFFILFVSPCGPCCPLTNPSCAQRIRSSIACVGYESHSIHGMV
jgi:hypothetical protein